MSFQSSVGDQVDSEANPSSREADSSFDVSTESSSGNEDGGVVRRLVSSDSAAVAFSLSGECESDLSSGDVDEGVFFLDDAAWGSRVVGSSEFWLFFVVDSLLRGPAFTPDVPSSLLLFLRRCGINTEAQV